ncbi:MAG: hypothetical protein ABI364_01795 [Caldimonas sp.]
MYIAPPTITEWPDGASFIIIGGVLQAPSREPDLVRVIEPVAELTRIWRLLTTKELRHTPRVSAFFDFIVSEIDTLRPIITG